MAKRQMFPCFNRQHSGITLLEFIVVLFIIAILIAILFPVFARTHHGGGASRCQNNLKQYTAAMLMYKQDANERYPTRYIGNSPQANNPKLNPSRPGWIHNALHSYLKNYAIMHCFSLKKRDGLWFATWNLDKHGQPLSPKPTYVSAYAYNYARFTNAKDAEIDQPADTMLMWESMNNYFDEQANMGWSPGARTISESVKVDQIQAIQAILSPGGDVYNYCSNERCAHHLESSLPELRERLMWHNGKSGIAWADGHVSASDFHRLIWGQLVKLNEKNACHDKPIAQCDPLK